MSCRRERLIQRLDDFLVLLARDEIEEFERFRAWRADVTTMRWIR